LVSQHRCYVDFQVQYRNRKGKAENQSRRDGTRESCVGFWCYCFFLLIVPSKIKIKNSPESRHKNRREISSHLSRYCCSCLYKGKEIKHDVNRIYGEDYCEER